MAWAASACGMWPIGEGTGSAVADWAESRGGYPAGGKEQKAERAGDGD